MSALMEADRGQYTRSLSFWWVYPRWSESHFGTCTIKLKMIFQVFGMEREETYSWEVLFWWELYWIQHFLMGFRELCAFAHSSLPLPPPSSVVLGYTHGTWRQMFGVELGLLEEETLLYSVYIRGFSNCLKPCRRGPGLGNLFFKLNDLN